MKLLIRLFIISFIGIFFFTGCGPKIYNTAVINMYQEKVTTKDFEGAKENSYLIMTTYLQLSEKLNNTIGYGLTLDHFTNLYGISIYGKRNGFKYFSFIAPSFLSQTLFKYQSSDIPSLLSLLDVGHPRPKLPYEFVSFKYQDENGNKIEKAKANASSVNYFKEKPYEYFSFSIDEILTFLSQPQYGFNEDEIIVSKIPMIPRRYGNPFSHYFTFDEVVILSKQ